MNEQTRFEEIILPHLDAAYNLAHWLAGNEHDAEDITQEAMMRAFRFFDGFRGGNSRSWLLTIVRHTAFSWFKENRRDAVTYLSNEDLSELSEATEPAGSGVLPDAIDGQLIGDAMKELPIPLRETLVLRELEELSYKEIAEVTKLPIGTVMSRLARARRQLQEILQRKGVGKP